MSSKKVDLDYIPKDGDTLFIGGNIRGAATVKCAGREWVIHKNDKDKNPSDFHAHDYEHGDVLDLYTGKMICRKGGDSKINKKHLSYILTEISKRGESDMAKKAKEILNQ